MNPGERVLIREATGHAYEGVYEGIVTLGRAPRIHLSDAMYIAQIDHENNNHDFVELGDVYILDDAASVLHKAVVKP